MAPPFRRWREIPHSDSTAWFLHVKSCSISIPCGFLLQFHVLLNCPEWQLWFSCKFLSICFSVPERHAEGAGTSPRDGLMYTYVRNIQTNYRRSQAEFTGSSEGPFPTVCEASHFSMLPCALNWDSLGMTEKEIAFHKPQRITMFFVLRPIQHRGHMPGTSPNLARWVFPDLFHSISSPPPHLWRHAHLSYSPYSGPKPLVRGGFVYVKPTQSPKAPLTALLHTLSNVTTVEHTCVCAFVHMYAHSPCVKVRGQLVEVNPFLPPCSVGISPQSGSAVSFFTWWVISLAQLCFK